MSGRKLRAPKGSVKKKKIVGRGTGSGKGGRCGRGNKGQNARSGGGVRLGFEGGQMPLYRRIARRGFSNARFKKEYAIVNLLDLERLFKDNETVSARVLYSRGLVKKKGVRVKILGKGELAKKLVLEVDGISRSAHDAVLNAGGKVLGLKQEEKLQKAKKAEEPKITAKKKSEGEQNGQ